MQIGNILKTVFFFLLSLSLQGQIHLSGKTSTASEDLIYVHVTLEDSLGNKYYTISDEDSYYKIELPFLGQYLAKTSYVGFKESNDIIILSDTVTVYDILIVENSTELSEVVVQSSQLYRTDQSVTRLVRDAITLSDGLSSSYIKKTPDSNVGDALKRVSGLSIQEGDYVQIRGLSDRYNIALMDGQYLPTTEPDRRVFSYSIIPTAVIDNIMVSKSAAANLPGEFAGGVVNIATKEIPDDHFVIFSSIGTPIGNSIDNRLQNDPVDIPSTFPTTRQFRGSSFDNQISYSNTLQASEIKSSGYDPNIGLGLSFSKTFPTYAITGNMSTGRAYTTLLSERLDYDSPTVLSYNYRDTLSNALTSTNAFIHIKKRLPIGNVGLKTLFVNQQIGSVLSREGDNFSNLQSISSTTTNNVDKTLLNVQTEGDLFDYKFSLSYSAMRRDQPDYRNIPLQRYLGTDDDLSVNWRDSYRFWSDLSEDIYNASLSKKINKVETGGSYNRRLRYFDARVFRYRQQYVLEEITNNTDQYGALAQLGSAYMMYSDTLNNLQYNAGVRFEYNDFIVRTADFSGLPIEVNRTYYDVLPSINLRRNYKNNVIRLSASKTLSRPELREVSNFTYYDFVRNAQIVGNTSLEKSDIYNVDLKWEQYVTKHNNISVSLFAKHFDNPIEQIIDPGSVPSNIIMTYNNLNSARLYGVEVGGMWTVRDKLSLQGNLSLVHSSANTQYGERALQGQASKVLNMTAAYGDDKTGIAAVSFHRTGDRLSVVGLPGYPDIHEKGRSILDLTYTKKLPFGSFKVTAGDILRQSNIFYQNGRDLPLIQTTNQSTINLSLNYTL